MEDVKTIASAGLNKHIASKVCIWNLDHKLIYVENIQNGATNYIYIN